MESNLGMWARDREAESKPLRQRPKWWWRDRVQNASLSILALGLGAFMFTSMWNFLLLGNVQGPETYLVVRNPHAMLAGQLVGSFSVSEAESLVVETEFEPDPTADWEVALEFTSALGNFTFRYTILEGGGRGVYDSGHGLTIPGPATYNVTYTGQPALGPQESLMVVSRASNLKSLFASPHGIGFPVAVVQYFLVFAATRSIKPRTGFLPNSPNWLYIFFEIIGHFFLGGTYAFATYIFAYGMPIGLGGLAIFAFFTCLCYAPTTLARLGLIPEF